MLEQLSLSVSTLLFFLCTAVVGSFFPQQPAANEDTQCAITLLEAEDFPSVVGKWNSGGHIIEFTKNGKFIYDGITSKYVQDGRTVTVSTDMGGAIREFSVSAEVISDKIIKINGITMYRTE